MQYVLTQVNFWLPVFWGEEGWGGGGGTKKRFVWRGSAPTSNTVPFIYYRKPNYITVQNKIIAKKKKNTTRE